MKLLALLFVFTHISFGAESTFHIKAAANAYQLGTEALRAKQPERAISLFNEAIRIEPTFTDAFESLAKAYLDSGRQLEAAAVLTQLIEFKPEATNSHLKLGQILLKAQQPQRAAAQFSVVLKRDPFDREALLGFAYAAKQIGLSDRASQALERGRIRYPSDARFRSPTVNPPRP